MRNYELNIRKVYLYSGKSIEISLEEFMTKSKDNEMKIETAEGLYKLYSFFDGTYTYIMTEWFI